MQALYLYRFHRRGGRSVWLALRLTFNRIFKEQTL